ncbi:MAG: methionine--tRNA ligase, partial [Bacteroidota bacterium]|nr:methionine--tRNA ligase [Bacteroidota bacterium]
MDQPKRYTVTAALPYANGPIHIGHLAGCYLPSDIYVRYLRLKGRDVKFLCGSDEHGVAITIKARKEGKTPQQVVDHFHGMMRDALRGFGISFDHYSRTSSPLHKEIATEFFLKIYEKGGFEEKETEQYYDPEAGQFLADRYIVGECPNCHYDNAYGDQCERCGTSLSPTDLINPRSTLSGAKPELRTTKNWFLPLDKLSPRIREYVESHKGDWKSNVYGQCKSWLDAGDGLQPRSMTRDLDWGVPVPLDGAEGKVLYVWFDAPLGYITSTRELLPDSWETWWKDKDTKLVHFIGKDNIVFHCIIFPAILMEHGEYILPDQVPANEFLNLEGEKISTSRNWAVWLHEYLEEFPGKEDVLRYALCASAPETKDNDFTWKDFQARNNNELVAILGNFYNRVMVLIQKYYNGQVPSPGDLLDEDQKVLKGLKDASERIGGSLENYKFRESLFELMNLARTGNKYLADSEPWKVVKTDPKRAETILFVGLQVAGALAKLSEPFLPFTAQKMQEDLHLQGGWDIPADGKLII